MMKLSRREFLMSSAAGIGASLALGSTPKMAWAGSGIGRPVLVLIALRGGMDSLHVVPPLGDPDYVNVRTSPKGEYTLAHDPKKVYHLDRFFGLHPYLKTLKALYDAQDALVITSTAPNLQAPNSKSFTRSHFKSQDIQDIGNGTSGPREGWVNRLLGYPIRNFQNTAISPSGEVPLVLHGDNDVLNWAPDKLDTISEDLAGRLLNLYGPKGKIAEVFKEGLGLERMTDDGTGGPATPAEIAVELLNTDGGPNIAVIEIYGWDSHTNIMAPAAQTQRAIAELDNALLTLRNGLASQWNNTFISVQTEFGRTVAPNGAAGTDHGTATASFLIGGKIAGGRVMSDWPGLKNLYQDRDLMPTLDLRAFLRQPLQEYFRLNDAAVDDIIPGIVKTPPIAVMS
jgi:uncharacterized protein (DUF1501 family)